VKTYETQKVETKGTSGIPKRSFKRVEVITYPDLTVREAEAYEYFTRPAHPDVILCALIKLFNHKRLTGTANEVHMKQQDYVAALREYSELELFDMVEYFLKNHEGSFAPQIAEILTHLNTRKA